MGHDGATDVRVPKVVRALEGKSPHCVVGGAEYSFVICDRGEAVYSCGWYGPTPDCSCA